MQRVGGRYEVTPKQVALSQKMLHEGCPVQAVTECPSLAYSDLADPEIIQDLLGVWVRLEEKTRGAGGEKIDRSSVATDPQDGG